MDVEKSDVSPNDTTAVTPAAATTANEAGRPNSERTATTEATPMEIDAPPPTGTGTNTAKELQAATNNGIGVPMQSQTSNQPRKEDDRVGMQENVDNKDTHQATTNASPESMTLLNRLEEAQVALTAAANQHIQEAHKTNKSRFFHKQMLDVNAQTIQNLQQKTKQLLPELIERRNKVNGTSSSNQNYSKSKENNLNLSKAEERALLDAEEDVIEKEELLLSDEVLPPFDLGDAEPPMQRFEKARKAEYLNAQIHLPKVAPKTTKPAGFNKKSATSTSNNNSNLRRLPSNGSKQQKQTKNSPTKANKPGHHHHSLLPTGPSAPLKPILRLAKIRPYASQAVAVSQEEILEAIPPDASSVFHIMDRRVNFDAIDDPTKGDPRKDAPMYSLLRAWVQDDPYRQIAPTNAMLPLSENTVSPTQTSKSTKKGKRKRGELLQEQQSHPMMANFDEPQPTKKQVTTVDMLGRINYLQSGIVSGDADRKFAKRNLIKEFRQKKAIKRRQYSKSLKGTLKSLKRKGILP